MILAGKLNQKCVWLRKISDDDYGDSVFDEPKEIPCRREGGSRLVRNKAGKEVMASTTYFVEQEVKPDDRLDSHIVINAFEMPGLFGTVEGWEVVC